MTEFAKGFTSDFPSWLGYIGTVFQDYLDVRKHVSILQRCL
jgi:hypothetical protein